MRWIAYVETMTRMFVMFEKWYTIHVTSIILLCIPNYISDQSSLHWVVAWNESSSRESMWKVILYTIAEFLAIKLLSNMSPWALIHLENSFMFSHVRAYNGKKNMIKEKNIFIIVYLMKKHFKSIYLIYIYKRI